MILYESEAKQTAGSQIQLSDSLSNYSQITFIITLYEENEAVGGVKHNIHVQIKSPSTNIFGFTAFINTIHSTWMFQKSGTSDLIINDKSSENWDNSKIGISKIIGY